MVPGVGKAPPASRGLVQITKGVPWGKRFESEALRSEGCEEGPGLSPSGTVSGLGEGVPNAPIELRQEEQGSRTDSFLSL